MTLYDISTATFTNQLDLTQGGFPPFLCWGVFWRDDGLKLYTINGSGAPRHILEWDVPTPYDLNTAVFLQQLTLSGGQFPIALRFKPDGTKMYAIDSWFSIIQWDLSIPWDVTTAVDSGGFVLNRDNENNDFFITEDGEKLFVLGSGASLDGADDRIYELDLIDPFDIDTAVYVTRPNPSRHITENEPEGFDMRPDGTRMWVLGTVSRKGIYQYNLSPPFDIFSGGNPFESFNTESIESNEDAPQAPWGLRFSGNPKGSKAYFTSGWYPFGGSPNALYELSMPFTQTTRDTGDALVVDALIIAQGSVIGNCEDEQFRLWRSDRAGGNLNDDHQFSHFELRPLHGPSSTPLVLGKEVTGIKVTKGLGGTSKFTLAIYSGPGLGFPSALPSESTPLNTQLRAFTAEVDFTGTPNNGELIVPLLQPYFIDSTDHDDIQVCIAVSPVLQPGHNRVNPAQSWRADDSGGLRKRITYKTFSPSNEFDYPDFPPDFLLNESDGPKDASFFELVTREAAKQKECFGIGARITQLQTKTTDPDQFKMDAILILSQFTTAVPAFPSVRIKGVSGVSPIIPPVEPKINALLQRTVGMGGIGNEPKIDALLSIAGPADGVTKFTGVSPLLKRLGENGSCTFFSDNFSSYTSQAEADLAWAPTSPGGNFFIRVNIENDNIDFNFNPIFFNGDNRSISHDLGAGVVPDDKWKLNAKINFTTFEDNVFSQIYIGLSDMDHNTSPNRAPGGRPYPDIADRIMIRLTRSTNFSDFSFKAIDTNDTFEGAEDDLVTFDFQTGVDYFLTVQRDSVTTYHVEVFTDEARTISLGRADGTCPSDLKDLRYILIQNFNDTLNFTVQGTIDDIFFTAESGSVGCFSVNACLTNIQEKDFTVNAIVADLALDLTWQYREHKTSNIFNPNMTWKDAGNLRMFTSTGSIGAAHTLKTFRLSEITGSSIKIKWERFSGNTGRGSITVYDGAISAESLVDIPNAGGIPFPILGTLTGQPSRFPLRTETLDSSEINYAGATGEFLTVVISHADSQSLTEITFDIHEVGIGRATWFFTGGIVITDVRGTQGQGIDDFGYVNANSTSFKNTFEDTFTIDARLVKEETKLKTFEIDAQIVNEDSKIFCIDVILIGTRKTFTIDSTLSIPVGVTPFTNFNIDAVISGITVNFDIDVIISDPFQTLESESVLGIGGGGV